MRRNIIFISLLLLATFKVGAQPQTITLEQCRQMALESSYNLRSSSEKIASAEDMVRAYKTNNLPNFSLSAGYMYSTASFSESITGGFLPTYSPDPLTGELVANVTGASADGTPIFSTYAYMPDMNFDLEVGSVWSAGVKATQPIYMGGKISTATRLAQLGVDAAQIERTRSQQDVILSADEAFYTYLKVEELLRTADAYRSVVDEFCRQVESMVKNGMATQNDLLRVQVKVNDAELAQLKAKNGLILARMNLCYIIGLPVSTLELTLVDELDLQQQISMDLDISARPEYELLAKSVEAKELEVKLAKSEFLPSISALASYNYANGMSLNGSNLLGSTPSFSGGVMVNVPIFHWGEGRRKVSAARREVSVAQNQQADLEQKMTLELMQSINRYRESQIEVSLMARTLEQCAENQRQSAKLYTTGMATLSNYLEAQSLWQKAMGELVEAKANQRLAYIRYCRCRGVL